MATKTLETHIVSTPGVVGGKPRIAGHRITVANVALWHELMGQSVDEIAADYDLTLSEVHAALAHYFDHKASIDEDIRKQEALAEEFRRKSPSKIPARYRVR